MFKAIPGNRNYQISKDGKIENNDGTACTLERQNNKVKLRLYEKEDWWDVAWLWHIADYAVYLPEKTAEALSNIYFMPYMWRKKQIFAMMFKQPIWLNEDKIFRIIPGYTDYAIDRLGNTINWRTKKEMSKYIPNPTKFPKSYPSMFLYSSLIGKIKRSSIHRLMALAWIPRKDPRDDIVVNHKNGNKFDWSIKNLEWVTEAKNVQHAVRTNLRKDNMPCILRDAFTGELKEFASHTEAAIFLGIVRAGAGGRILGGYRTRSKLINDRYELRNKGDDTPWFFENKPVNTKAGRWSLHVTWPDGRVEEHPDIRTFKKQFGVWNVSSVKDLIDRAKVLYPGVEIKAMDHYKVGEVQALFVESDKIIEADSIRGLAAKTGQQFFTIQNCLKKNDNRVVNGYAYRWKSDEPWNKEFAVLPGKPKCILATHLETGEKLEFGSLRAIAKHFNADRSPFKRCLMYNVPYGSWKLELQK